MRLHYVPAGTFIMGNDNGWAGQKPAHEVNLDAFWIDETEVTNHMYALCVQAGVCQPPQNESSYTREKYYPDPQYANYPVIYVSWQNANAYCAWAGRALPMEAQWEKAARGTDERLYPWGNQPPNQNLLNNFDVSFLDDTVQVGSYPQGVSPYGALDMAGNAWEWTADWFNSYPGGDLSASENYGQTYRVLRGGSFVDAADATTRYPNDPELRNYDIGFRCVFSASFP
ncbi:MAG: SUMF1/EgtB/PvdO family nonheme iron enzyme [Chloroflexi bacterium]|nr:SUMF1/EgtB/PvdO family nonheme iron enzyme [Chloroflexota bacterium]